MKYLKIQTILIRCGSYSGGGGCGSGGGSGGGSGDGGRCCGGGYKDCCFRLSILFIDKRLRVGGSIDAINDGWFVCAVAYVTENVIKKVFSFWKVDIFVCFEDHRRTKRGVDRSLSLTSSKRVVNRSMDCQMPRNEKST